MEEEVVKEVTGTRLSSYGDLFLAAYEGRPEEATPLIAATADEALARGEGLGLTDRRLGQALLHNGSGHYAEALAAAERAADGDLGSVHTAWALPELIEAAVRSRQAGRRGRGAAATAGGHAIDRLRLGGGHRGTLAGAAERGHESPSAEYAEAVERLGRTPLRPELARAHLLYGEWLRREGRRVDARDQLARRYDAVRRHGRRGVRGAGAQGAARHRREGPQAGGRHAATELTPQEEHIARLARDGHTNPEIGAELFISARRSSGTCARCFTNSSITSRKGLHDALPARLRYTTQLQGAGLTNAGAIRSGTQHGRQNHICTRAGNSRERLETGHWSGALQPPPLSRAGTDEKRTR